MPMRKRLTTLLVVVACMPLIMAGGGANPPTTGLVVIPSNINATIMVDPHPNFPDFIPPDDSAQPNSSPSGRLGRITLTRDGLPIGTESFELVYPLGSFGALVFGCTTDPSITETRFGNAANPQTMHSWVPQEVVVRLFAQIGISVYSQTSTRLEPVITKIRHIRCVQSVTGATPPDGILHVEADIGFGAPSGTNIPNR